MVGGISSDNLARFVKDDVLHATEASLSWSGAESILRAAWRNSQQLASGRVSPSSFGVYRSQSESSEKENLLERKSLDVVVFGREPIRAQSTLGSENPLALDMGGFRIFSFC